ncbi:hypothetical protein NC651_024619 [Populus alba x Populus x berolinensis]|nr:hypothetical protein NC651_024619 [Populus alba x Populus x berolinensis]
MNPRLCSVCCGVHASAIIVWAMEELARNPRTMKKAQDEIRKSVGKKGRLAKESIESFDLQCTCWWKIILILFFI